MLLLFSSNSVCDYIFLLSKVKFYLYLTFMLKTVEQVSIFYQGNHISPHFTIMVIIVLKQIQSFLWSCGVKSYFSFYRNVFIIFSLHTEMDENRCTNGIFRVANYTTFAHRFTSISVCNEKIIKTFLIIQLRIKNTFAKKMPFSFEKFIATSWERCNVARMYP